MDTLVIERKLDSLRRCLARVEEKCPQAVDELAQNLDLQDILVLNLSRAVQLCVDMGGHILTQQTLPPPIPWARRSI